MRLIAARWLSSVEVLVAEPHRQPTPGIRTVRKFCEYPRLRGRKRRQEGLPRNSFRRCRGLTAGTPELLEFRPPDHLVGSGGARRSDIIIARVVGQHEDQAVPHQV